MGDVVGFVPSDRLVHCPVAERLWKRLWYDLRTPGTARYRFWEAAHEGAAHDHDVLIKRARVCYNTLHQSPFSPK
jgi:hypothetical protein